MMSIANRIAALIFMLCAAVQLNDPDGVIWVAIYGAPVLLCVAHECGRTPRLVAAVLGGLSAVGAAAHLWSASNGGPVGVEALQWSMVGPSAEPLREGGGLLLIAVWSAVLATRRH